MTTEQQPLAQFVDRRTMVYERRYPHPIGQLWDAVSTAEHLDAWMLPTSRVERGLGGACSFTWGGPPDEPAASTGHVSVWEPPTAVEYRFDDGSWMRFDLAEDGPATRLAFKLHFRPTDVRQDESAGGDYPVPGTAWQPGFLAGFHEMLDQLDGWLRGNWTLADNQRALEQFIADGPGEVHLRLIDLYRDHVREHCPPA